MTDLSILFEQVLNHHRKQHGGTGDEFLVINSTLPAIVDYQELPVNCHGYHETDKGVMFNADGHVVIRV